MAQLQEIGHYVVMEAMTPTKICFLSKKIVYLYHISEKENELWPYIQLGKSVMGLE